MADQNKPKFTSFFNNNLPKEDPRISFLLNKLDLLENRVKLLETDNKKLKDELKKLS